jgi:hypothetical protein
MRENIMFKNRNDRHTFSNLLCTRSILATFIFTCSKSGDLTAPLDPDYSGPPLSQLALFPSRMVALVGHPITLQVAIITKTERDADPVPCEGEQPFTVQGTLPDWLDLN